jgi:hypothetical protein
MLKKILIRTGIALFVLIGLLLLAPFIFKKQILNLVKTEVNKNLQAQVDFSDVSISFFRHFPKVAVALNDLTVIGKGDFKSDTLISADKIDAAVNFMSIVKGKDYKIYSVEVSAPRIYAHVLKDGRANWEITLPDTASSAPSSESKPFKMNLEKYAIHKGYIKYNDESSAMSSEVTNLEHEGTGDFTADLFTLKTKTTADAVSFIYEGIPYLSKVKASIDAAIDVDNKTEKYSFKTDQVFVNDLKLNTEGFFQMPDDGSYNMDFKFNAPSTDFKNILSLIPSIYQKDFASIKTSGTAVFNGFVKGVYNETTMPAYAVNLDIKDGFFQYPDLPKPVKNINLSMKIDNPDGVTDHTVVNIPTAHIEMDNDPFDFHLNLQHPVTDMLLDAGAKGKIDLSKMAQLVKLDKDTKMSGILNADIQLKGAVSAMQKQDFDHFTAAGSVNLDHFFYASKDYPDGVKLNSLLASLNPKNVTLSQLQGEYLETNFSADGRIDNLLPYMLKNQPLTGALNIKADHMDLDKWMSTSSDTTTKGTAAAAPFLVPSNLDFTVRSEVGKVHYDNVDLDQLSGSMNISDETVWLKDIKANALDGTMNISGSYSTKLDKKKPDISLTYDVQGLDVQKTFYAFNTVQKLMPVGKFIAGKMSSKLTVNGKLGDNMMPDLNSLTGSGSLLLIEGFLKKFAPIDKLASTLNVQQLQDISLKDIKNYIEFSNGRVLVKPFNLKVKDIDMEIGGTHGLDQSLDYIINLKVPRALMGSGGNQLIDNLVAQANSKGVPLKAGDVVNLKVNMGGFITNPQIKTNLKESATSLAADLKQQATDFAKAKVDTAKKMVKDSVTAFKNQVVNTAKETAKAELARQLNGTKDTTNQTSPVANAEELKKVAENSGKAIMKNLFGKKKKDTTSH